MDKLRIAQADNLIQAMSDEEWDEFQLFLASERTRREARRGSTSRDGGWVVAGPHLNSETDGFG